MRVTNFKAIFSVSTFDSYCALPLWDRKDYLVERRTSPTSAGLVVVTSLILRLTHTDPRLAVTVGDETIILHLAEVTQHTYNGVVNTPVVHEITHLSYTIYHTCHTGDNTPGVHTGYHTCRNNLNVNI